MSKLRNQKKLSFNKWLIVFTMGFFSYLIAYAAVGEAAIIEPQRIVLELGSGNRPPMMVYEQLDYFSKKVDELSKGKIKIVLHKAGVLGTFPQMFDMVRTGTLDMCEGWPEINSMLEPKLSVICLPYQFKDFKHGTETVLGHIGEEMGELLLKKTGVKTVSYLPYGFRQLITIKRPVKIVSDMKGLKVRVPEAKNYFAGIKKLGGEPVVIPWGEVYTALQTGLVDAAEAPFDGIEGQKWHEVGRYITVINWMYQSATIHINEKLWEKLPDYAKDILKSAAKETVKWQIERWEKANADAKERLMATGKIKEIFHPDLAPFRKGMDTIQDEFAEMYGYKEWIKEIRSAK